MTVPASNISLITHVRNGFMQETSGNASLNSTRYRDGARKGAGDVSLTDFANRAWSQGRTIKRSQDGDGTGSVRPYVWDQRWDNINHNEITWTLSYNNGLPTWESYHVGKNGYPTAAYLNSYFYCDTPTTFTLNGDENPHYNNWKVSCNIYIVGFASGYLSGASTDYITTRKFRTGTNYDFTTSASRPYIVLSFNNKIDSWNGNAIDQTRGGYTLSNLKVVKK